MLISTEEHTGRTPKTGQASQTGYDKQTGHTASSGQSVLITLNVNGRDSQVQVQPQWTLLHVLREVFGFTGTKEACGEGACGACTVIVDGMPVLSCMMLAIEQTGRKIETIEGLAKGDDLHPLQETWLEEYGAQCGFCSPGMIMSAKGLLERRPEADVEEIKEGMGGNICICGNYEHILKAILKGHERLRERHNEGS